MKGYSERRVFDRERQTLLARATAIVNAIPTWWYQATYEELTANGPVQHENRWLWCERSVGGPTDGDIMKRTEDKMAELRCHELTRAVATLLDVPPASVIDGKYGRVEHSWILLAQAEGFAILDVYSVGRLPQVQLVHVSPLLPTMQIYQEGPPRGDISVTLVAAIVAYCKERRI